MKFFYHPFSSWFIPFIINEFPIGWDANLNQRFHFLYRIKKARLRVVRQVSSHANDSES
jgi:hypothetical protein